MVKVTKPKARKLYNQGVTITLIPCKVRAVAPGSMRAPNSLDISISNIGGATFDELVTQFEYYNCNEELGRYAHYYVPKQYAK